MSSQTSKLVVVTVVKDDIEGFDRTCRSIAEQSVPVTHLIINGGSSADMQRALDDWSGRIGSRIISGPDNGPYDAMNKALRALDSRDRVWFINAGDTLAFDEAYAYVDQLTSSDEFTWGFGPVKVVEKSGILRTIPAQATYTQLHHAYGQTPICHQAVVACVDALRLAGGFDDRYPIAADYRSLLLLGRIAAPVQWELPTVEYRAGGLSDRHLLRSHWQQHRIRIEVFNGGMKARARSWARLAGMTARITTGRGIDAIARAGLVDRDWRRPRRNEQSMDNPRHGQ
ncbi:MAG: hypothetical protein WC005_07370 [Candidatus Nanopelagicales bacterium]